MNIGIDVTSVLPGGICGGVKQLVIELLRGFVQAPAGDRFILLTAYYNENIFREFERYGAQLICILSGSGQDSQEQLNHGMFNQNYYSDTLKKNNIDVLFCPMTDPVHNEPGIPAVSLICDLQHLYYPLFFSAQELKHRHTLYERLKTRADYVVCISSHTKKTVLEKLRIPEERVFVIPISVHERLNKPRPEQARATLVKYNLAAGRYCIYPANLWPHKNHKMLLLAFSRFLKLYPQCSLDLVLSGDPVDHNNVMNYSRRIGLTGRVHFLGYLPEEELAAVWEGAHFLIFPSLFVPEVAGGAALYFDPRRPDEMVEALRRIMSDEALYGRLVEEGRRQVEKYRYEDMVQQYLAVLHRAGEGGSVAEYAEVTGIYDDCWAGERIEVGFGAGRGNRVFTLQGYIPSWHPTGEVKLKITLPDGRKKSYVARRDEELTVHEQLPEQAGVMNIAVSGGARQNDIDTRTLSFMVRDTTIVDEVTGKELYAFDGNGKENILRKNREFYQHILELGKQLRESEADRAARLARMEELEKRLAAVSRESSQQHEHMEQLLEKLRSSDAEWAATVRQTEALSAQLQKIMNCRAYKVLKKIHIVP